MASAPCLKAQALQPGESTLVEIAGKSIAVFNVDGSFCAIDNTCPHRGAPLSEGQVEAGKVVCPWHAFRFDLRSGGCERPPGYAVATYKTTVKGEEVFLDLE